MYVPFSLRPLAFFLFRTFSPYLSSFFATHCIEIRVAVHPSSFSLSIFFTITVSPISHFASSLSIRSLEVLLPPPLLAVPLFDLLLPSLRLKWALLKTPDKQEKNPTCVEISYQLFAFLLLFF